MRKTLLAATPVSILSSVMLATLGYYEIIRFPSVASWLIFIAGVVSLVSSTVIGCCLLVIEVRTATSHRIGRVQATPGNQGEAG